MELFAICLLLFVWNIFLTTKLKNVIKAVNHSNKMIKNLFCIEDTQSEINKTNQTMFKLLAEEVFGVTEEQLLEKGKGEKNNECKL